MQNEERINCLENQVRTLKRFFVYISSFALLFSLFGCSSKRYSKIPLAGFGVSYCRECGDASRQCHCESSFTNRAETGNLIIGIDKETGTLWAGGEEDIFDNKKLGNQPNQPTFPPNHPFHSKSNKREVAPNIFIED